MLTKKEGNVERWQNSEVEEKDNEVRMMTAMWGRFMGTRAKQTKALWKTGPPVPKKNTTAKFRTWWVWSHWNSWPLGGGGGRGSFFFSPKSKNSRRQQCFQTKAKKKLAQKLYLLTFIHCTLFWPFFVIICTFFYQIFFDPEAFRGTSCFFKTLKVFDFILLAP